MQIWWGPKVIEQQIIATWLIQHVVSHTVTSDAVAAGSLLLWWPGLCGGTSLCCPPSGLAGACPRGSWAPGCSPLFQPWPCVLLGRAARAGCLRQGQDKAKARPPDPSHCDCQQRSQEGKLLGLLHNKTTAEQPSGKHPWKFFVVSHLEPPSAQPQKGMGWGQAPPNKEAGGIRCLYAAPWAHSGKLYRTLWHHLLNKVVLCF